MYLAVAIAGKVYSVFAQTYNHAIAQAVGQAVAEGIEVNKQTFIEIAFVDGTPIEIAEQIVKNYKNSNL
ncbi:hypothetical protein FACHB389_10690 [Nostoc calcicola FACHB-389]|nr:hypothetical protein [Nostoc calcicola FACHB-3891]OKH36972.1 hypothetical protein FACHB389_10690 [Nostoc calcicola FACHB-389]